MKLGSFILCVGAILMVGGCGSSPPQAGTGERVVLLHGLGRTDLSMYFIEEELSERGYRVFNVSYPSTEHSIQYLAEQELAPALERCCSDAEDTVHFVTHSMGGIVLRYYLEDHEIENLGRVVMISPPNKGTELADWVAENEFLEGILGPSVEQLGTGTESLPTRLGPVDFELGIIAGNRSLNPLFSRLIPGEDDGKVAVEATKVPGMSDFLVVPHSHTYIMMNDDVVDQVAHFLEHGRFRDNDATAPEGSSPSDPEGESNAHEAPAE